MIKSSEKDEISKKQLDEEKERYKDFEIKNPFDEGFNPEKKKE